MATDYIYLGTKQNNNFFGNLVNEKASPDQFTQSLVPAGFIVRFVAKLIDYVVILFFVWFGIFAYSGEVMQVNDLEKICLDLIVTAFYYIFSTASRFQATIGKRIMGIYVISNDGSKITLQQSLARYICYFFSYITLLIGFFMTGCTKRKTALHDLMSGTYVVYGKMK